MSAVCWWAVARLIDKEVESETAGLADEQGCYQACYDRQGTLRHKREPHTQTHTCTQILRGTTEDLGPQMHAEVP